MTFTYRYLFRHLILGALIAAGCGGGGDTTTKFDAGASCPTVPTYAQLMTATFSPRCSGRCHGGASMPPGPTSPAGPIDLSSSSTRAQLVDRASIHGMGLVLVVPGDPSASFLMRKLTDNLPADGTLGLPMPEGEAIQWSMIPQAEVDAIKCWIAGGAP
ncbi:MAG TPA: hypothetical protein VN903_30435 [Polyangia bacterium]|jgi:hypothetical protein|nr:hypothetical protein [Polyangia bacterium]